MLEPVDIRMRAAEMHLVVHPVLETLVAFPRHSQAHGIVTLGTDFRLRDCDALLDPSRVLAHFSISLQLQQPVEY